MTENDGRATRPQEISDVVDPDRTPSGEPSYEEVFGEPLEAALNPDAWQEGADLYALYALTEQEILDAVAQQDGARRVIRQELFKKIATRPNAPPNAGVWKAERKHIENVHSGLLFNGGVEASDGTSLLHDSLPLTIAQLAVYLVAYNGSQGSWAHRVFRRDLRRQGLPAFEETIELLERRRTRSGQETSQENWDSLTQLARRGIMAYMERAMLMQKSTAVWRMGHGNPAPYELLTGSGSVALLSRSLDLLNEMLAVHKKIIFVPSAPAAREWLTIGDALRPWEFAIIDTLEPQVEKIVRQGHYRGQWSKQLPRLQEFQHEVASKIVFGVYRASSFAPAYLFYTHQDYAFTGALIAIADSMLQEHRGFPMLIELADLLCRTTYGADTLGAAVQSAYTIAGTPLRYIAERETRH